MATQIMQQPSLLDGLVTVPHVHKRQRSTAREAYRQQRATDSAKAAAGKETREGQVLRCLAAFWNRFQVSPTARELFRFMVNNREPVDDVNSVRPRLTKLEDVGLVSAGDKRVCQVSGKTVHVWRVREAGSLR